MKRAILGILIAALMLAAGAGFAQTPFVRTGATVTVSATSSSSSTALVTSSPTVWVCNTGANTAYVGFGDSSVVTTTADIPLVAGICGNLSSNGATYIAAITASAGTTILATPGSGTLVAAGGGGSGGGGGGAVTVADGADVAQGAIADAAATAGSTGTLSAKLRLMTTQLGSINTLLGSGSQKTQIVDGSGNVIASTSNNLNVQCANCSGSGASAVDEATFTAGSSVLAPSGGFFQTTATSNALTTGQQGMWQMTANRAGFVNLRNAAGTEVGTSTTPVQVSVANTGANATAIKVDGSAATQPVSGTFWQATQPVSIASMPSTPVTGTFWQATQPVSQAASSVVSGAYLSGAFASGAVVDLTNLSTPIAPGTATATKGILVGGQYDSTQKTLSNGQQAAVSLSPRGAAIVATGADTFNAAVTGTVTANAGTNLNTSALALEAGNLATLAGGVTSSVYQANVKQVNGVTTSTGTGAVGTGTQRVAVGTDTATIAGSAPGTAGSASANVVTVQGVASMTKLLVTPDSVALPANQSVNVSQINAVTPLMGNGVTGTGSQRVTIASDTSSNSNPFLVNGAVTPADAAALGTTSVRTYAALGVYNGSTVDLGREVANSTNSTGTGILAAGQLGQCDDTSPTAITENSFGNQRIDCATHAHVTTPVPSATAGGTTLYTLTLAASTNATNVKASAGQLYSISGFNMSSATPIWISLYNNSGTPTCGTSIIQQFMIPGNTTGAGFVYDFAMPKGFSSGIAFCATTGIAGTGNAAASTYVLNIDYK